MISTLYQLETTALGTFLQSRERLLMVPAWVADPGGRMAKRIANPLARLEAAWMHPTEEESCWPIGPTVLLHDDATANGFRLAKQLIPGAQVSWVYTGVEQIAAWILLLAALQRVQQKSVPLAEMKGLHPQFEVDELQSCLRLSRTSRGKGTVSRIMHEQVLVGLHWKGEATRNENLGMPQWLDERAVEVAAQSVDSQFFVRTVFDGTVARFSNSLSQPAGPYFLFGNRIDPDFTRYLLSDNASQSDLRVAIWCSLCRVLLHRTVVSALRARNETAALAWLQTNRPQELPDSSGLSLVQAGRVSGDLSLEYARALTVLEGGNYPSSQVRDMELRLGVPGPPEFGLAAVTHAGGQPSQDVSNDQGNSALDDALQRFCWVRGMTDFLGPNAKRHRWPGLWNTHRVDVASRILRTIASPVELATLCEQIAWTTDGSEVECRNRDEAEQMVMMMAAIVLFRFLEGREPEPVGRDESFEQYVNRKLPRKLTEIRTALIKFPATELPPEFVKLLLLLAMHRGVSDSVRGHARCHKYGPETLQHLDKVPELELRKLVSRSPTLRMAGHTGKELTNVSDHLGNYYLTTPSLKLPDNTHWALQRLHLRIAGANDGEKSLRLAERLRQYGHVISIRNGRLESVHWVTNELGALSRRKKDWTDEAILARTENLVDRILLNLATLIATP